MNYDSYVNQKPRIVIRYLLPIELLRPFLIDRKPRTKNLKFSISTFPVARNWVKMPFFTVFSVGNWLKMTKWGFSFSVFRSIRNGLSWFTQKKKICGRTSNVRNYMSLSTNRLLKFGDWSLKLDSHFVVAIVDEKVGGKGFQKTRTYQIDVLKMTLPTVR